MPEGRVAERGEPRHYPHCEAPERFVEVLVDFITSTRSPPASRHERRGARGRALPPARSSSTASGKPPVELAVLPQHVMGDGPEVLVGRAGKIEMAARASSTGSTSRCAAVSFNFSAWVSLSSIVWLVHCEASHANALSSSSCGSSSLIEMDAADRDRAGTRGLPGSMSSDGDALRRLRAGRRRRSSWPRTSATRRSRRPSTRIASATSTWCSTSR